jgi:hypothetical protein
MTMRRWVGAGWWILALGCGDSGLAPTTAANIQVVTSIEGVPIDQDGYSLSVDGGSGSALGVRDTIVLAGIAAGDHILQLSGISAECQVRGLNPRTVKAVAGGTVQSAFALVCNQPGTGRLRVSTFTYGRRPNSYLVSVTGGPSTAIGPEDEVTLFAVPAGLDTVTLSMVPPACDVMSSNPRVVLIPEGEERVTLFKVNCPL